MFKSNALSAQLPNKGTTIICAGTQIDGNLTSKTDLRIDGKLNGNLTSESKVVIGPEGKIHGDIVAKEVDVLGEVIGNIHCQELLQLKDGSRLEGDIHTGKLLVDPNANFNGSCNMNTVKQVVAFTETA